MTSHAYVNEENAKLRTNNVTKPTGQVIILFDIALYYFHSDFYSLCYISRFLPT